MSLMTSCHKEEFIEYVAEMSIQTFGFDSAEVRVSGYLTNTIETHSLGFSYTTEGAVYQWNSENVNIEYSQINNGGYVSTISNLVGGETYKIKPFAKINGTRYYTAKEFSFTVPSPPNSVGDVGPGGGIVFYSDGLGGGMEVLIGNWHAKWGGYGVTLPTTGTGFGTGQSNTDIILNYTIDGKAAEMCDSCTAGGYSDWFLPSLDELKEIQLQLVTNGSYGIPGEYCWSSTGSNSSSNQNAWAVNMIGGAYSSQNRNTSILVLPVRVIQ